MPPMLGDYQLNTCNNDPEFFVNVSFGIYDGTWENIPFSLLGNTEKGCDGVITLIVKGFHLLTSSEKSPYRKSPYRKLEHLCDKDCHWLVPSVLLTTGFNSLNVSVP